MSFNFAQTFYVDKASVQNVSEVGIAAVELFFRGKPKRENNKSGIVEPGVSVFITPVKEGIPVINELSIIRPQEPTEHGARFVVKNPVSRLEWSEIQTSVDATIPTVFKFRTPVQVNTNQLWAIVIKFDGDEDFLLWTARQNQLIVDTATTYSGASDFQGKLFGFISPTETQHTPGAAGIGYSSFTLDATTQDDAALTQIDTSELETQVEAAQDYLQNAWKPYHNEDLMFSVYAARYADKGYPVTANAAYSNTTTSVERPIIPIEVVSNNVLRMTAPSKSYEFLTFSRENSNNDIVYFGETYWQDTPAYPGGTATPLTVSISNGSANVIANGAYLYANGTTFNNANGWNNIFSLNSDTETIIIDAGSKVYVRKVRAIESNTVLIVDENIPITNTVAKFYIAPTARLWSKSTSYTFGLWEELAILTATTANSTTRFVNNSIASLTITAEGTGYSNSDYIVISGFENVTGKIDGGYAAYANIVTDASGNVQALYLSNIGAGFVNTAWLTGSNVVVTNSSGSPVPSGTANGLTFDIAVGTTLRSEFSAGNTTFANCVFVNLPVARIKPEITVNNPIGTGYTIQWGTGYYEESDGTVEAGKVIYKNANNDITWQTVKIFKEHDVNDATQAVIPSRSNEFAAHYSNGSPSNPVVYGNNETLTDACFYKFTFSSNNDYSAVFYQPEIINSHLTKYIINNDYTDEHTNYGNAYSKHIVNKVPMAEDRLAEDILVYLTAYRPLGTDFKVYARIHNGSDLEAFDDKDWTLLEQTDGIGVYSSQVDDSDLIELTYSFSAWPNAEFTQTNTVTTILGQSNVNTTGTATFDPSIVANDIVRIYQPLFPNNYVIDVVQSVTNSSQIILRNPIANDNVVDSGLKIQKIGYPKQAFKYNSDRNVVRYYNEDKSLFTRYDTFQVKVCLLSNSEYIVPEIDDIRVISVTA